MNVRGITKQMTKYGKTFGLVFYDNQNPIHQAINQDLHLQGCTVKVLDISDIKDDNMEISVYVALDHDHTDKRYAGPQGSSFFPPWTTLFSFVPRSAKCWGDFGLNQQGQSFFYIDDKWKEVAYVGQHHYKPAKLYTEESHGQNAYNTFEHWILGLHPELVSVFDRCIYIYAGTQEEHAIERVPVPIVVDYINKKLAEGKDKIFFINADEALLPLTISKCHAIIDMLDVPRNSVYHITATLNGTESYQNLCNVLKAKARMQIVSGYRFENVVKNSMGRPGNVTECCPSILNEYQLGKRDKVLTCFNRMPRWHRAKIVGMLFENNLIDNSFVSFSLSAIDTGNGWCKRENWQQDAPDTLLPDDFKTEQWTKHIYAIGNNWDRLPLVINRTVERDNPVDIVEEDKQYHDNSYFSVVNETNFYHALQTPIPPISMFHTDGVFISEKLYKPIAYRHPFIVVALPKTLEYIRKCGYKTFDGIFDESYDLIEDDHERMDAVIAEILRVARWSHEEWAKVQPEIKSIVDFNCEWLLQNKKLNTTDFDLLGQFN